MTIGFFSESRGSFSIKAAFSRDMMMQQRSLQSHYEVIHNVINYYTQILQEKNYQVQDFNKTGYVYSS